MHVASVGHPATPQLTGPLKLPWKLTVIGMGVMEAPAVASTLADANLKSKSGATWTLSVSLWEWLRLVTVASVAVTIIGNEPAVVIVLGTGIDALMVTLWPGTSWMELPGENVQGTPVPNDDVSHASFTKWSYPFSGVRMYVNRAGLPADPVGTPDAAKEKSVREKGSVAWLLVACFESATSISSCCAPAVPPDVSNER